MEEKTNLKTLKVRVKDKHKAILERMAFEVNQVWNTTNEITALYSYVPIPEVGWVRQSYSAFDLQKQLKGIKAERGFIIHSTTVQEVIAAHHKARRQFKTDKLRWRVSCSEEFILSSLNCPVCGTSGNIRGRFEYNLSLSFECEQCYYFHSFENTEIELKLNASIYVSENILNNLKINVIG